MRAPRTFEPSVDADFDVLMAWFADERDVRRWGGPEFEFPFTPSSFRRDCHWPDMASFSLRDDDDGLLAFGQFYERHEHVNLARIGVRPGLQGQGIGRQFMRQLMSIGSARLHLPAYSLYVYRDNEPALRCYRSLGFEISPYPSGEKLANVCYYMTRPAGDDAGASNNNNSARGDEPQGDEQ